MAVEVSGEDFAGWDWEIVELAGTQVFSEMHDLIFHAYDPDDGWTPFAEPGDVSALIVETRAHLDRLETAIKKARADIAGVERNARLAARRRQKAERKAERNL
jgi:hypothetical protein